MMIDTAAGVPMDKRLLHRYLKSLVGSFFKILPLWEDKEPSLPAYLKALQEELLGCQGLILAINEDPLFMTLVSTLQFLIDNPESGKRTVKRIVFEAISVCNSLSARYAVVESHDEGR